MQQLEQRTQKKILREELERENSPGPEEEEIFRILQERFSYQYPYDIHHPVPAKITVSELKRQSQDGDSQSEELYFEPDVIPLVPEFIQKKEEKLTGALRGTAYHRVLECLDYRRADSARQIREQMESWVEEQKLSPLQRDCVRRRRLLPSRAPDWEREWRWRTGREASPGAAFCDFTAGAKAECRLGRRGGGSGSGNHGRLVSGGRRTGSGGLQDGFRPGKKGLRPGGEIPVQLDSYAEALERMTGRKVKEKWIWSFFLGREIPV